MREQVLDILTKARRRLTTASAARAAAALAVTAALASAAVQAGWSAAMESRTVGMALCLLPAAVGLAIVALSVRQGFPSLRGSLARLSAAVLVAAGLAAAGVFSWAREAVPAWSIPLALLPAAAVLGAAWACLRPESLRQVAMMLDERLVLRERLATALELAARDPAGAAADKEMAEVVYAQAVSRARQAGAERVKFEGPGNRMLGVLGLSVLLAAALLALPGEGNGIYTKAADIEAAVANMTDAQKQALIDDLLNAAKSAPTVREQKGLVQASEAIKQADPKALKEALAQLAQAIEKYGLKIVKVESPSSAGNVGDDTNSARIANGPIAQGNTANHAPPATEPDDPSLVVAPNVGAPLGNAAPADPEATTSGTYVPFDQAWRSAVSQANQSLRAGSVPPRCQRMVRDFFLNPK